MKSGTVKVKLQCIFICLLWHCSCSSSMYSGSWCPYKVEKIIPCKIRNGTEPYYGPNICWKSVNGSHSCTKKILYRPKFVTTYKKIYETTYKCCPGLEGSDCQNECFNCSTYQDMILRVDKLESEFNQMTRKQEESDLYESQSQSFVDEDIFHENLVEAEDKDKSLTFIALNTRIGSLISEFRDMESRIRTLESEILRLSSTLNDAARNHPHIVKEKLDPSAAASYRHLPPSKVSPYSNDIGNYQHYFSSKTSPLPNPSKSLHALTTETSTKLNPSTNISTAISIPGGSTLGSNPNFNSNSNSNKSGSGIGHNRQKQANAKSPSSSPESKSQTQTGSGIVRHLEDNLERGDIASTLNDDYGEEILFENSTEQYIDPLHNKEFT